MAPNGSLVGYFEGGRGLRQEYPISPYLLWLLWKFFLFCLVKLLERIPSTSILQLTQLCFADDLLIFVAAIEKSANSISGVLSEFANLSGLVANLS
jgi:hypothetical protein